MNNNEKFLEEKRYTNYWIVNFHKRERISDNYKFYKKFQKNIKHYQQVMFIKNYLKYVMKWLDAPIGSGRLMNSIQSKYMQCIKKISILQ